MCIYANLRMIKRECIKTRKLLTGCFFLYEFKQLFGKDIWQIFQWDIIVRRTLKTCLALHNHLALQSSLPLCFTKNNKAHVSNYIWIIQCTYQCANKIQALCVLVSFSCICGFSFLSLSLVWELARWFKTLFSHQWKQIHIHSNMSQYGLQKFTGTHEEHLHVTDRSSI